MITLLLALLSMQLIFEHVKLKKIQIINKAVQNTGNKSLIHANKTKPVEFTVILFIIDFRVIIRS